MFPLRWLNISFFKPRYKDLAQAPTRDDLVTPAMDSRIFGEEAFSWAESPGEIARRRLLGTVHRYIPLGVTAYNLKVIADLIAGLGHGHPWRSLRHQC